MEINAYLLFGIDFRPYLEKDDSVRAEASKEVITEIQHPRLSDAVMRLA